MYKVCLHVLCPCRRTCWDRVWGGGATSTSTSDQRFRVFHQTLTSCDKITWRQTAANKKASFWHAVANACCPCYSTTVPLAMPHVTCFTWKAVLTFFLNFSYENVNYCLFFPASNFLMHLVYVGPKLEGYFFKKEAQGKILALFSVHCWLFSKWADSVIKSFIIMVTNVSPIQMAFLNTGCL